MMRVELVEGLQRIIVFIVVCTSSLPMDTGEFCTCVISDVLSVRCVVCDVLIVRYMYLWCVMYDVVSVMCVLCDVCNM